MKMIPMITKEQITEAVTHIIAGKPHSEIVKLLMEKYGTDHEETTKAVSEAKQKIQQNTLVDIDKIIPSHVNLYEKIFVEFQELGSLPGKLATMRQKEKILGLHREDTVIEINNELNLEIGDEVYNRAQLTSTESDRLDQLFKKVKLV